MIPLPLHLLIHFFLAVIVGYLAGRYFKKINIGVIVGICGGFLIDLDHVLEYFLVYGFHFNITYFFEGRQFLISNQLHLWFHAWEYIPIILLLAWFLRKYLNVKAALVTLALAMSVHLLTDCVINQVSPEFYTLSYRMSKNFSCQKLMSPEAYQKNLELKQKLGL
jgi:membrane-bound metal-dependent hydrolase YbcI (DUF457 family)